MDILIAIADKYGIQGALIAYVIWSNRERETRYLDVIKTLSEEVKERLSKIESTLRRKS